MVPYATEVQAIEQGAPEHHAGHRDDGVLALDHLDGGHPRTFSLAMVHAARRPDISQAGVTMRLVVRRQRVGIGHQLSFDDLDGYRFQAVMTNIPPVLASAAQVEHHHRLRGGGPEEVIRQLKGDFGFAHAPVKGFFGNWLWWCASVLAYNVARWLRILSFPAAFRRCRGKRLRIRFLNVAARVVRSGRRLRLRLPHAYPYARDFVAAIERIRSLPKPS